MCRICPCLTLCWWCARCVWSQVTMGVVYTICPCFWCGGAGVSVLSHHDSHVTIRVVCMRGRCASQQTACPRARARSMTVLCAAIAVVVCAALALLLLCVSVACASSGEVAVLEVRPRVCFALGDGGVRSGCPACG